MSVGPLGGLIGSAAGAPLSQTSGSEAERTQRDAANSGRAADTDARAERAAGIGTTEQDQETNDRDADGRRLWEESPDGKKPEDADEQADKDSKKSKDTSGLSGNHLDLTG